MEPDIRQLLERRLAELPDDIRRAVESADLEQHVREIGESNGLHIDQMGKLEDETLLVMLGFASPDEFPERLAKELGVPPETAALLAVNIGSEIFMPIRESMQKFVNSRAQAAPPPPLTAPVAPAPAPASAVMRPPETAPVPVSAPQPTANVSAPSTTDHLLSTTMVSVPKVVEMLPQRSSTTPPRPQSPATAQLEPEQKKIYSVDPYREPAE